MIPPYVAIVLPVLNEPFHEVTFVDVAKRQNTDDVMVFPPLVNGSHRTDVHPDGVVMQLPW